MKEFESFKNQSMTCPRCLGNGFVDNDDIRRLGMLGSWTIGPCEYCKSSGSVKKGSPNLNSVTNLNATGEEVLVNNDPVFIDEEKPDYGLFGGVIGIIFLSMFLFQITSTFNFNFVLLIISVGLLAYSYKQEESLINLENLPYLLFGLAACLIIGIIVSSNAGHFPLGTLVLTILVGIAGAFFYYSKNN